MFDHGNRCIIKIQFALHLSHVNNTVCYTAPVMECFSNTVGLVHFCMLTVTALTFSYCFVQEDELSTTFSVCMNY